jgi:hypothetical protein
MYGKGGRFATVITEKMLPPPEEKNRLKTRQNPEPSLQVLV